MHLTADQRTKLENVKVSEIIDTTGTALASSESAYTNSVISNAIVYFPVVDSNYTPTKISYKLGIDTSKVLQPSSVIDGGTY